MESIWERGSRQPVAVDANPSTEVLFESAVLDDGSFRLSSGVLTCVESGPYSIRATVSFEANDRGLRTARLEKAPLSVTPGEWVPCVETHQEAASSTAGVLLLLGWAATLEVGDALRLKVGQDSDQVLDITGAGITLERLDADSDGVSLEYQRGWDDAKETASQLVQHLVDLWRDQGYLEHAVGLTKLRDAINLLDPSGH